MCDKHALHLVGQVGMFIAQAREPFGALSIRVEAERFVE